MLVISILLTIFFNNHGADTLISEDLQQNRMLAPINDVGAAYSFSGLLYSLNFGNHALIDLSGSNQLPRSRHAQLRD